MRYLLTINTCSSAISFIEKPSLVTFSGNASFSTLRTSNRDSHENAKERSQFYVASGKFNNACSLLEDGGWGAGRPLTCMVISSAKLKVSSQDQFFPFYMHGQKQSHEIVL